MAEPGAADAAKKQLLEAEQAVKEAVAAAREAVERVTGNAETTSVTALAAKLAAEKAAAKKARQEALGEQEVAEQPAAAAAADSEDEASATETDLTREKIDAEVAKRNRDRDNLLAYLGDLRGEQTSLIDRTNLAIDAFETKGGKVEEVEEYRQYVTAVAGIEVDVTDVSATWATLTGWPPSSESSHPYRLAAFRGRRPALGQEYQPVYCHCADSHVAGARCWQGDRAGDVGFQADFAAAR